MSNVRLAKYAENPNIETVERLRGERNEAWLARVVGKNAPPLQLVLLGGNDLLSFRVRAAQAVIRGDLRPSQWSHVGLLVCAQKTLRMWYAGIDAFQRRLAEAPAFNNIEEVPLTQFGDPSRFPNVALVHFPSRVSRDRIAKDALAVISRLQKARAQTDLITPRVRWQGHALGAAGHQNPLIDGLPMPCALFAELVYGALDVDISPGVGSSSVCAEGVWHSARFWSKHYADAKGVTVRRVIGQPDAAVIEMSEGVVTKATKRSVRRPRA